MGWIRLIKMERGVMDQSQQQQQTGKMLDFTKNMIITRQKKATRSFTHSTAAAADKQTRFHQFISIFFLSL